ncbi:unnamed protein product [Sympodiomycopsis kandeliae]
MVDIGIINSLTLEERIKLTAGQDLWRTYAFPEKGIPYAKLTDGPNGARGGGDFNDSVPAALFPSPSCLASSFDGKLAYEMGRGIALDSLSKQCHVSLAPTINVTRDQRYGRAFENYGEDPLLLALTGSQWVQGCQGVGVGATPKHFVANEAEVDRRFSDSQVGEAALREVYLEPFRRLFKEVAHAHATGKEQDKAKPFGGQPACIMTAYNRINGTSASENRQTLINILRKEWGWNGLVMSDWFALHDHGLLATDLEMPGPSINRRIEYVKEKLASGEITEEDITERAKKVLELLNKVAPLGLGIDPAKEDEKSILDADREETIRKIASEGSVLLKNKGDLLPLDERIANGEIKKIALIGVPWTRPIQSGGGSANLTPQKADAPLEVLRKALDDLPNGAGKNVKLVHHHGTDIHRFPALATKDSFLVGDVKLEYFTGRQWPSEGSNREVAGTRILKQSGLAPSDFGNGPPDSVKVNDYSFRATFELKSDKDANHVLALAVYGEMKIKVDRGDGQVAVDTTFKGEQDIFEAFLNPFKYIKEVKVALKAGETVKVVVESLPAKLSNGAENLAKGASFHVGVEEDRDAKELIREASDLAKSSDVAIVMSALGKDWESEGYDRPDLRLPRLQDDLITSVGEAQAKTILLNIVGSAVEMPWQDKLNSIVQTWYGGQETGQSVSDILLGIGSAPASGRLCTTWPVKVTDQPGGASQELFPGKDLTNRGHPDVLYKEGRLIGYKWYEKKNIKPNYWFGSGLGGYTSFERKLEDVQTDVQGDKIAVQVKVTVTNNSSKRSGKDVVQVYVGFPDKLVQSTADLPIKKLGAFQSIHLSPSESKTVTLQLQTEEFSYWVNNQWQVEADEYSIILASSADPTDVIATKKIKIEKGFNWTGMGRD